MGKRRTVKGNKNGRRSQGHKKIYAQHKDFMPQEAFQKFGVLAQIGLHPTFKIYEIHPLTVCNN